MLLIKFEPLLHSWTIRCLSHLEYSAFQILPLGQMRLLRRTLPQGCRYKPLFSTPITHKPCSVLHRFFSISHTCFRAGRKKPRQRVESLLGLLWVELETSFNVGDRLCIFPLTCMSAGAARISLSTFWIDFDGCVVVADCFVEFALTNVDSLRG